MPLVNQYNATTDTVSQVEAPYVPAIGGKVFSDGRSITVRQVSCWGAEKMDTPETPPESWRSMSDVERVIWVLENSDKPAVQYASMRAEWNKARCVQSTSN